MKDISDVTLFLNSYYTTFSTLDVERISPFFHEPCLFISPQGVVAAPTYNDVEGVFRVTVEILRSKEYGRSELTNLQVRRMSEAAMLASGVAVRYKISGQELERVGVTYILQKSDNGWRIAVTVIHDADSLNSHA